MTHLTQKERTLLQDQLNHEQICVTKYSGYASRAKDPRVRNMFNEFASEEQQHYDTINTLLQGGQAQAGSSAQTGVSGAAPASGSQAAQGSQPGRNRMSGSQGSGQQMSGQGSQTAAQGGQAARGFGQAPGKGGAGSTYFEAGADMSIEAGDDKAMLSDMLMTEKFISGTYDTAVFESANTQVRQALQHIQKDEQKHGEEIFKHMQENGMYQPQ